jgi:hypothetical protein
MDLFIVNYQDNGEKRKTYKGLMLGAYRLKKAIT